MGITIIAWENQILKRLVKFYNDWSGRPLNSGIPGIFYISGQKYCHPLQKSRKIAIHHRNSKKWWFVTGKSNILVRRAKITKYRDSATNVCPSCSLSPTPPSSPPVPCPITYLSVDFPCPPSSSRLCWLRFTSEPYKIVGSINNFKLSFNNLLKSKYSSRESLDNSVTRPYVEDMLILHNG